MCKQREEGRCYPIYVRRLVGNEDAYDPSHCGALRRLRFAPTDRKHPFWGLVGPLLSFHPPCLVPHGCLPPSRGEVAGLVQGWGGEPSTIGVHTCGQAMRRAMAMAMAAAWAGQGRSSYESTCLSMREEVRGMFAHAFGGYMRHAFPHDELKPITCDGKDSFGKYALTLVDSLDALAIMGFITEFEKGVEWTANHLAFDYDETVSVFETNIRVLGGLLSAHLLATDPLSPAHLKGYTGKLLELAHDLGERLLPAFVTRTGIPYGAVNLVHGVAENETTVTSSATSGTLLLEFVTLSRLTGDPRFEDVARQSAFALWARRSPLNLVGGHLDVQTGNWTHQDAGIGSSIDSFYEYLYKSYLLFGDPEYLYMFKQAYSATLKHLKRGPWYVEVNMYNGNLVWPVFNSLQAFWPGLQAMVGDLDLASETFDAFFHVWKNYGSLPEGFNIQLQRPQEAQMSYPLRPELIESAYHLFLSTHDKKYLEAGETFLRSLQLMKTECGFAALENVYTWERRDQMESYFLSETLKYLYLLFSSCADPNDTIMHGSRKQYVFTTEGHLLPIIQNISNLIDRKYDFPAGDSIDFSTCTRVNPIWVPPIPS